MCKFYCAEENEARRGANKCPGVGRYFLIPSLSIKKISIANASNGYLNHVYYLIYDALYGSKNGEKCGVRGKYNIVRLNG